MINFLCVVGFIILIVWEKSREAYAQHVINQARKREEMRTRELLAQDLKKDTES